MGCDMKLTLIVLALLPLTAGAALACIPAPITQSSISHGEACSVIFRSPEVQIGSGTAERLTERTFRQFITTGICGGESIVVYYDCTENRGVWLGGQYEFMSDFRPEPKQRIPRNVIYHGPADYFVDQVEPELAPSYDIDAIYAKAATLPWIEQMGRISSPAIKVEGRSFYLGCGCKLKTKPAP
jgi:ribosome modulation factor